MPIPKVTIIGRTNVGKSTLFNRLTESGRAIVSPIPGTTRDRNFGECLWRNRKFTLVDTGGLEKIPTSDSQCLTASTIENKVIAQTLSEIDKADLVILLLDVRAGIMPQEKEVVRLLRKKNKKIILAINKCDTKTLRKGADPEFYKLGLGNPSLISAASGAGTGNLLDEIINFLPAKKSGNKTMEQLKNKAIKISIIGRPNVGKSSLLNALAGQEMVIVSEIPHTTREAQNFLIKYEDQNLKIVDTAGIRRKPKIDNPIEKLGVKQSLQNIRKSDIIIFMIDASEKLSKQDQSLARLIKESNKPVVVLANKWDLVKGVEMSEYEKHFRKYFPHLSFAPLICLSCETKRNTAKILNTALGILKESNLEITDNALNKFLTRIMTNLKKFQGKSKTVPRLIDLKQTNTRPPAFEIIMKESKHKKPHPSTMKYVENQLREKFNLKNIPVKITLRTIKIKP